MNTDTLSRGKIRVGILRGGPSPLYDVSLKSGSEIRKYLPPQYVPIDIFVSRDGEWHISGKVVSPSQIFKQVDVVWNSLQGTYGEDGKVQQILKMFGIPYTGSHSLASSLGMNKNLSKALMQYHGYKTPSHTIVHTHDNTLTKLVELFHSLPHPSVIKPLSGGGSYGVHFAHNFETFKKGIEDVLKQNGTALVEEYIPGIEVMCGVMQRRADGRLFAFDPILPDSGTEGVYGFEKKHGEAGGATRDAVLTPQEKELVQKIAKELHSEFNLRHYSTSDMVIHPKRGVFVLEVNSQPSMTESSLYPKALKTANISMEDFIDEVIELALSHTQ